MPKNWITQKNGKFLKTYNPPRLNKKETGNMNRLITNKEIEFIIKSLLIRVHNQIASQVKSMKHSKKN